MATLEGLTVQINDELITPESWTLMDYGDVSYLEIYGDGFVLRKKIPAKVTRKDVADELGFPL